MRAPIWLMGTGAVLLGVGIACGGSSTSGGSSAARQGVDSETPQVPILEEPVDPSYCLAPTRDDFRRHGGAFELAEPPTLELHVDVAELIVIGNVVERELIVIQPWWFNDNISPGEEAGGGPLPILNCTGRYTVEISDVLKNDGEKRLPSRIKFVELEREAHFLDDAVLELLPPLALGQQAVVFLLRGGLGLAPNTVFGPRFDVQQGVVTPFGDYAGYADEFNGASVDSLVSRIRARVAEMPEARPLWEVAQESFDDLMNPTPLP